MTTETELAHTITEAKTKFKLVTGTGNTTDTACAMTLLSWIWGDKWTDHPDCAHPLITSAVIKLNDRSDTTETQRWQLVEAGLTGVLDTWWIPAEVILAGLALPKPEDGTEPTLPSLFDRTITMINHVATWKTEKTRPVLRDADLSGADLSGAVLRGADLRRADLSDAVLRGAVLRDAVLRRAVLRDAVLRRAVLSDADLRDADLSGADLRGAVLSGADLRGADLSGAVLRGADLRGAVLRGAVLRRAVLSDAVLRDAVLSGADLRRAVLSGADLRGADLSDADLRRAVLRGAVYNQWTSWPAGYDTAASGAVKV